MLQSHFQFQNKDRQSLLSIGGFVSALIFVLIVAFVLYRSLSTALFRSERASATDVPRIQDEQLRKVLEMAKKWKRETITQTPKEEPTPPTKPAPAELSIAVRNGTTIPDLASETAKKLQDAGFTQIVEASNAEKQNYTATVLRIKPSLRSYTEDLRKALSLPPASLIVEELQEKEEFDIVIIVGREGR